mgnify:CR=1 FL=1
MFSLFSSDINHPGAEPHGRIPAAARGRPAKARKVAAQWADDVKKDFGMECTVTEGKHSDTVEFSRSGVKGELTVAADHFELTAKGRLQPAVRDEIYAPQDGDVPAERMDLPKWNRARVKRAQPAADDHHPLLVGHRRYAFRKLREVQYRLPRCRYGTGWLSR